MTYGFNNDTKEKIPVLEARSSVSNAYLYHLGNTKLGMAADVIEDDSITRYYFVVTDDGPRLYKHTNVGTPEESGDVLVWKAYSNEDKPAPNFSDYTGSWRTQSYNLTNNTAKEYTVPNDCWMNVEAHNSSGESYGVRISAKIWNDTNSMKLFDLITTEDYINSGLFPVKAGTKFSFKRLTTHSIDVKLTMIAYI